MTEPSMHAHEPHTSERDPRESSPEHHEPQVQAAEVQAAEIQTPEIQATQAPAPQTLTAPESPPVDAAMGRVELFGSGELPWRPVSEKLITTRTITLVAWLVPFIVAGGVLAVLFTVWSWVAVAVLVVTLVWGLWLIRRQVRAMSYIELTEDLVIRKGRVFRQVSSIPFGRLQYVDVQSGPLERKYGMATLQIFTASPSTSATIPGLPIETAEEMRERLMARGEAQRAGL